MKALIKVCLVLWLWVSLACDGLEDSIDSEAGGFWQSFPLVKDSEGTILGNAVGEGANQVTLRTKNGYLVQILFDGTFGDGTIYFTDDNCSSNPAGVSNQDVAAKTVFHSEDVFYVPANATDGYARVAEEAFDYLSQTSGEGCLASGSQLSSHLPLQTITRSQMSLPDPINGPLEVVYGDD